MPSIAEIENRLRESSPAASRTDIRKAAKLHVRRFESFTRLPSHEEALLLVKAITYQDETGDLATGIRRAA